MNGRTKGKTIPHIYARGGDGVHQKIYQLSVSWRRLIKFLKI